MSTGGNIHAQTVEKIAGWITKKRFAVGDNLPIEPAICAELGVSRTVVREAIKTLAAKGLVSTGPRIGTRVLPRSSWNLFDSRVIEWRVEAGIDETFINDLVDLRMAIEPAAAMLAATRGSQASRARLLERYSAMARAVDEADYRLAYLDADLAFHAEILHATGNQFFISLAPMIAAVLQVSFRLSVKGRAMTRQSLPDHRTIAEAIAAGDGPTAANTLRDLIGKARRDMAAEPEPNDTGRKGAA